MLSGLKRDFLTVLTPPFAGLLACVVVYFFGCFVAYPDSEFLHGNLPDPDDYMYLTQVIDWIGGQGWYDNLQHRLNPPDGVPLHFTRLAQLPIAAVSLIFHALGLPIEGATILAALALSILYLVIFLASLRWSLAPVMPQGWAAASAFVALFSVPLMLMYQPMHIDHTGLILILTTLAVGAVLRMMAFPQMLHWPVLCGFVLGTGLAIALEILPWLLLIVLWVGIWSSLKGGQAARSSLVTAIILALTSCVWLLSLRPLGSLGDMDLLLFSTPYVILTSAMMFCFVPPYILRKKGDLARLSVAGVIAMLMGGVFLHFFPQLSHGPYGAIDPALESLVLGEVREAKPLWEGASTSFFFLITRLSAALIALVVGVRILLRFRWRDERFWQIGLIGLLFVGAFWLSLFYERRFLAGLGLFTTMLLALWLATAWQSLQLQSVSRVRFAKEMAVILLVGFIPAVLVPALVDSRSINKGVFLFPAYGQQNFCDMAVLQAVLNDPSGLGSRPRTIINTISSGPELLFRTKHKVLSAPYHTNVAGNVDTTRFFATPFSFEAEEIARRHNADLVVMCRAVPDMYMRAQTAVKGADVSKMPTFIQILMSGKAPVWLKMVKEPRLKNFVVYEIDPSKFSASGK